jgi:hypothetical protein
MSGSGGSKPLQKLLRRPTTSCYELKICVNQATGLRAADVGGTSDPYCKLMFGDERIGKTKAINYTLEPKWDEEFILTIPTQHANITPLSFITCEIWDKDSLSADDLLGSCRVYLPRTGHMEESWHNLNRPSGGEEDNGRVLLRLEWSSFMPHLAVNTVERLRTICPPSLPAHSGLFVNIGPFSVPPKNEAVLATLEEISLYAPNNGTLFVTDCRIVFIPYAANEKRHHDNQDYRICSLEITYPSILNVTTSGTSNKSIISFELKNAKSYTFSLSSLLMNNESGSGGSGGSNGISSDTSSNSARNSVSSISSRGQRGSNMLSGLRDVGALVGSRRGSVTSKSIGSGPLSIIASEIQWRCEEGNLAFSVCEPYIDEHRALSGHGSLNFVQFKNNNENNDDPNNMPAVECNTNYETNTNEIKDTKENSRKTNDSMETKRNENNLLSSSLLNDIALPHDTRREKSLRLKNSMDLEMCKIAASSYMYDELQRLFRTAPVSKWLYINKNWSYELCPSYSRHIAIPKTFPLSKLKTAASYRSKQRLPALTWIHPENNAPLCRCAQPRSGFTQMASMPEDDEMLLAIRSTAITNIMPNPILHIFDARPKLNANANALAGKGFENIKRLGGSNIAKIIFCGIGNIHVMRNSLISLTKACEKYNQIKNNSIDSSSTTSMGASSNTSFYEQVGQSKWLDHLALLIRSSSHIADTLSNGSPCVVHCSDGWDRTSQLSAISQLLLDPYYRTINGFIALIEKDFHGFGHKFKDRIGTYASNNISQNERSPIFLQFLDVIYQIYYQHTASFEFDENLLLFLSEVCYNGYYGTFLCNNEQERCRGQYSTDTLSCWEYVYEHKHEFLNPLYDSKECIVLKKQNIDGEDDDENEVVANSLIKQDGAFCLQQSTEKRHLIVRLHVNGDTSSMVLFKSLYMKESIHRVTPYSLMKKKLLQLIGGTEKLIANDVNTIINEQKNEVKNDSTTTIDDDDNIDRGKSNEVEKHLLLVEERRRGFVEESGVSVLDSVISPDLTSNDIDSLSNNTVTLTSGCTFTCHVKKVSIIRGDGKNRKGRYAAYLVHLSLNGESKPATCAFRRRFSDFVWLESEFKKCKLNEKLKWDRLPSKDLFRWYGHEYLEDRRSKLNVFVQQLSMLASKSTKLENVIFTFLDSSLPAGLSL